MQTETKQNVIIQLPWAVPQQPLVTTHIQVDPTTKKIPLDIQHSTDTTAIWSFMAAMIASMVVAIWYGRKSFKLTEMSFKIVSEDIKQAAEIHREVNKSILDNQKAIKNIETILALNQQWSDKLVDSVSELTQNLDAWILRVMGLSNETLKVKKDKPNFRLSEDKYFMDEIKLLHAGADNIRK